MAAPQTTAIAWLMHFRALRVFRRCWRCGNSALGGRRAAAGPGVAVREFPLQTGHADYMLYADGRAVGVVEAKPEDYTLTGVEIQSAKYTAGLPDALPHWHLPLPFGYESTGTETQFTNSLDSIPRSLC